MQIGKVSMVGRYELLAELGRGAMGIVYQARDPKIDRFVALKTISLQGCTSDEMQAYRPRLFHEAQAAGRLSHPGIVTIFDVGESPDTLTPYIVMEYVPGRSLEEVLSARDEKLSLDNALRIVQELAEALDYAHKRTIVHRDIKPSNIIIAEDGHPKITDFGIAKLDIADPAQAGSTQGTPAYMSPEQWNQEAIDGRSDLFSLGVILYTLLTGHRPFQGNSILTMSFKVSHHDPVRATAFMELGASPDLDHVTARALAREPAQRYQSGNEMALDLQDLRSGIPPRSRGDAALKSETKEKPATNNSSFCQVAIETVSQRQGDSPLKSVHFSKPSQQLSIAFSTLGFLSLAFGFLWQVIPDENSTARNLRSRTVNIASANIGVSAGEPKAPPISKATSPASTRPHRLGGQLPGNLSNTASSPKSSLKPVFSTLHISVAHHFATANLSIWVDDRLSFQGSLQGALKKHMIVLRRLQGYFSDSVQVLPGEHRIRASLLSQDGSFDESEWISGSFIPGSEKTLRIDFGKDNRGMRLSLK
jgi:serine/threonine-protein kinase